MNNDFENIKVLVAAINKGQKQAFKYIYDQYYNELCVYALNLENDRSRAEDIVQNAMLNLWNNRTKINIHSSLRSYLYRSVYNQFINEYRRQKKELTYLQQMKAEALNEFAEFPDETVNNKIKLVKREIENLPVKCREAFVLNKVNGLKYKEVAEEMNISVKTVEAHIHKAMLLIKKRLEDKAHLLYFILSGYKKLSPVFFKKNGASN